jgi:hypothetical protein
MSGQQAAERVNGDLILTVVIVTALMLILFVSTRIRR